MNMASQDNVPQIVLISLIAVFVLTGGLGFYFMSQLGNESKPESLTYERKVQEDNERETRAEIEGLRKRIEEVDTKIAGGFDGKERQLRLRGDQFSRLKMARAGFLMRRDIHTGRVERLESTRREVERYFASGEHGLRTVRSRKDDMEQEFQERRSELQARIDDAQKELTKAKHRYERKKEEKRKDRSRLNTALARAKDELERASARDPIEVDVAADGVVLNSNIEGRLVVVDIGEQQGVKRGMRFEVFQLRNGGRRVRKGFVDVRSVDRETASCIIIDRKIRLPRCPACGYIGRYPEEQFCPNCTGGGILFQRLRASPRESSLGMNPSDPIVVGDLIQNPLFDAGRKLRFAVKGDPLHTNFRTEDLMTAIRWHGGVIDSDVGAQTDVLLAGKWATEESRKASELGIHVLYHYELFHFLRK